jgi:hypothetical protein
MIGARVSDARARPRSRVASLVTASLEFLIGVLARPGLSSPAAALLVLVLWIWVIRAAPKLAAGGQVAR